MSVYLHTVNKHEHDKMEVEELIPGGRRRKHGGGVVSTQHTRDNDPW